MSGCHCLEAGRESIPCPRGAKKSTSTELIRIIELFHRVLDYDGRQRALFSEWWNGRLSTEAFEERELALLHEVAGKVLDRIIRGVYYQLTECDPIQLRRFLNACVFATSYGRLFNDDTEFSAMPMPGRIPSPAAVPAAGSITSRFFLEERRQQR